MKYFLGFPANPNLIVPGFKKSGICIREKKDGW